MSVSVIIAAYNAEGSIGSTIESVLRQTSAVSEIIVVDDGSTDGTAAVARNFGAPVRVFTRPNARQGASRNFGVHEAKGDWIAFVDSDDLWEPTKLEKQMEEARRHPEADVLYTNHVRFMEQNGELVFCGDSPPKFVSAERIRAALLKSATFLTSSAVIRRTKLIEVGGFATNFRIAEDWDLWLKLLHAGASFASCSEQLVLYRIHSGNVTSNKLRLIEESRSVLQEHVFPHMFWLKRLAVSAYYNSMYEAESAYQLRTQGKAECLNVLTRSILRWPIGDLNRYKIWLHMLLSRLGVIRRNT